MPRYSNDPRWITVKFPCKCAKCGAAIKAGQPGFYYPIGKSVYGKPCGCADEQSRDFESARFDESVYNNSSL